MQIIRFQPLHTSEVQKLLYKLKITRSSLFVFPGAFKVMGTFRPCAPRAPQNRELTEHSASSEVHFSINKTPSLQFPPIPEQATQMVRQAQEKVRKDKTFQYPELGGPVDQASSDLVTFFRGRRTRTADGREPRLRQRTDTERKETRDGQDRKSFCFFYIVFCFVLFS